MSADNGIYILETPIGGREFEYRVAHCQGIDDLTYGNDEGDPELVVSLFGKAPVFPNKADALLEADRQASKVTVLEYGISTIILPFSFYTYCSREQSNIEDELGY